ncbi:DUF418 domain-containing protein [Granulicella sibirica]|uniref:DUF418 domain-containing protein n=1 Tax=Granulicella sibirica TaxID=2479048 RepID=UPI0013759606|nr:DUF418 domain-containing protein [Granulicella sibirica]
MAVAESESSLEFDRRVVGLGAEEELAGPPHVDTLRPVTQQERISSMDVLRGFALMGILVMNITSFGLPGWAYTIPVSTALPVFDGPHWRVNTIIWFLRWVLAEGKMRGLFSMLFGAGVILLTSRAEARGGGDRVADIYLRRNMWLVVFGVLHAYLIWDGDILYFYGMTALLFLYPCRKLKAKTLIWTAAIVLLVNGIIGSGRIVDARLLEKRAQQADAAYRAGKGLTPDQAEAITAWHNWHDSVRPPKEKLLKDERRVWGGYLSEQRYKAREVFDTQTRDYYLGFGDVLGFMLLGMGMFRNGFLTAKLKTKTYVTFAVVGLGIAWPLVFAGCWIAWKSHFDLFETEYGLFLPYDIGRAGGTLGTAALVLLVVKSGAMGWLTRRIAAVGQMALSNYLLTSTCCQILFVWSPLKWYSRLEYYQLYFVVLGVWALNLTWSTLWLQYFQYGPMEWAWRSLTYWRRQPMRLLKTATA